jgi:hypothetical protein
MNSLEQFASRGLKAQVAVNHLLEGPEWDEAGRKEKEEGIKEAMRPRSLNPTPLINRAAVKNFLLEHAFHTRTHRFSRVSAETLRDINEAARSACLAVVRRLPSKGKTI